jgi:hypothetical protein
MSDPFEPQPFVYDGMDPVPKRRSIFAELAAGMNTVVGSVNDAIEKGRKPGMPLSVISNVAREAPLASLSIAFMLGVMVARRR